ncbi:hypothetical protein U1Q18_050471, partial [Sarracenia purpurea var. burkii]
MVCIFATITSAMAIIIAVIRVTSTKAATGICAVQGNLHAIAIGIDVCQWQLDAIRVENVGMAPMNGIVV